MNQQIFSVGQTAEHAYLVEAGAVNVTLGSGDEEVVLDTIRVGDIFGEMALVDNQPRSVAAVAIEPTKCVLITRTDFDAYFGCTEPVGQALLKLLANRLRSSFTFEPGMDMLRRRKKQGQAERSVSARISFPEPVFELLRDVAIVRSFGRQGNVTVNQVILDALNKARSSLEQEAEKLNKKQNK